ncbi:MAG TPA: TPM domain-containing protein [Vicinamibacterales bacterium]|nr:TPM domain-containing protein [Vicinamibacterales bacterium]
MTSLFVTRALGILVLGAAISAQGTLPKPAGRITDLANVIDAGTESELDRRLDELEQKTSHEVAVVTVTSLDGTTVDDYAVRLFKEWGVGQAKQDNGVLVLVAPNEREMRIEVGYGLEGILPDGLAGEIIRDTFIPRFRNDDYNGGIRDGVLRVADIVEKEHVLTPEELARFNEGDDFPEWALIPFFGMFVTIGFGMMGIGVRTKTGFPLLFGGLFGGTPLLMSLAAAGMPAWMILLPWALFVFVIGYRLGGRQSWRDAFRSGGKGGGSSSGWTMGSTSSGSSSSSSSGSSSSFGGGSSGGGGASGRW